MYLKINMYNHIDIFWYVNKNSAYRIPPPPVDLSSPSDMDCPKLLSAASGNIAKHGTSKSHLPTKWRT